MFFFEKFHPFQRCKILDRVFGLERLIMVFNAQILLWEARGWLMEGPKQTWDTRGGKEFSGGAKFFKLCPIISNYI